MDTVKKSQPYFFFTPLEAKIQHLGCFTTSKRWLRLRNLGHCMLIYTWSIAKWPLFIVSFGLNGTTIYTIFLIKYHMTLTLGLELISEECWLMSFLQYPAALGFTFVTWMRHLSHTLCGSDSVIEAVGSTVQVAIRKRASPSWCPIGPN